MERCVGMISRGVKEDNFRTKGGYAEGYKYGPIVEKEEAREVGFKIGFEVGEAVSTSENGSFWSNQMHSQLEFRKSIKQMEDLIEKYPLLDPEDAGVQEIMDSLRVKFGVIRACLGFKLENDRYPKPKEVERV